MVVVINRDGEVHLSDTLLTMIELEQRLTAIRDLRPDRTVYLRADKNVRYGTVVDVMAAVRQSGIFKLGMVTEPLQTE